MSDKPARELLPGEAEVDAWIDTLNERMAKPAPLVSDAELDAAMDTLARISDAAGRPPPIPRTLMRCVLEKAAFARLQMTRLAED